MTGETRTIATWGGAAGAVALMGLAWVIVRSGSLAEDRARIQQLAADQAKAQPAGMRLDAQIAATQKAAQEQDAALAGAAKVLVPDLKAEYRASDLTSAANRVATDLKALRQRAERTRVTLPASLPLESGLDADDAVRQMQLAQLWLYRSLLDLVMDAGVTRVGSVAPGRSWTDPSGTYAVLSADLDVEAPYEGAQALLQGLLAAHAQGIGLRGVALIPGGRPDGPLRMRFTATLLTHSHPEWKLAPEKSAPVAPKPAAGARPATQSRPSASPPPATAGPKPSLGDD